MIGRLGAVTAAREASGNVQVAAFALGLERTSGVVSLATALAR